ncbi:cytochrome-c peroxidase [Moritella viscosa]|uniref:Probable cytochrome-c peroxidase n=1 Tax=Moritella viscosa TaxID=80854 RepID=A0A1K9Z7M1_9GAMM|nr:cytochrome c peroxidase [Moritella viscosa]SGY92606.1 Probable cytochrome-c peroxidase [Moritella viscosa]SHO02537.1 Probable cytochrome-c peroxidase [Moritella viscosa]SHO02677.1 Probable cytochrome-c peroxidase [Moritella viscosa]SHO04635.1 Probable cytochrome-c peroxidase [Moritella viscosa]SHO07557.1 Probable cytochrome-c peroxidase [Moritella viscosa]
MSKKINLSTLVTLLLTITTVPACAQQDDKNDKVDKNAITAEIVAASLKPITLNGMMLPALAPLGAVSIPADNPMTAEKIELGKKLFFDGRIGGDGSTACVACHNPALGWDFPTDLSLGYPGTVHWRNSQTIINSAYYGKLFWAGSSKSLEGQAKSAAKGAVAGNGEDDIMEARLALIPEYVSSFNQVFGDNYPKVSNVWKAMAAFERTLVQTDTPLDNYLMGDKTALTQQQLKGKILFEGKAQCIACHNSALASDQKYYNIGVPTNLRWDSEALAQITFRYELYSKGYNEKMYRKTKADPGVYFRGKRKEMKGKFRTPSLRYTKYTAPYMHNGTLATLADVVDFYDRGGIAADGRSTGYLATKSALIKPLGLTMAEKSDLLAFLDAFSGERITMDYPTLPPYQRLFTEQQLAEATK